MYCSNHAARDGTHRSDCTHQQSLKKNQNAPRPSLSHHERNDWFRFPYRCPGKPCFGREVACYDREYLQDTFVEMHIEMQPFFAELLWCNPSFIIGAPLLVFYVLDSRGAQVEMSPVVFIVCVCVCIYVRVCADVIPFILDVRIVGRIR